MQGIHILVGADPAQPRPPGLNAKLFIQLHTVTANARGGWCPAAAGGRKGLFTSLSRPSTAIGELNASLHLCDGRIFLAKKWVNQE